MLTLLFRFISLLSMCILCVFVDLSLGLAVLTVGLCIYLLISNRQTIVIMAVVLALLFRDVGSFSPFGLSLLFSFLGAWAFTELEKMWFSRTLLFVTVIFISTLLLMHVQVLLSLRVPLTFAELIGLTVISLCWGVVMFFQDRSRFRSRRLKFELLA